MPKKTHNPVFVPANILLPTEKSDLSRWAALACDQFTSQPEYWQQVEDYVQDSPSTYNIILPEVFLEKPNVGQRIEKIHDSMRQYKEQILSKHIHGYVYIRREMQSGSIREGLVGCVDLEEYSYLAGENPRIRPSEGTIVDRIPPRLEIRKGACLETPHILMLIDDPNGTVIEPLFTKVQSQPPTYAFDLMLGGGNISAWAIEEEQDIARINTAVSKLEDAETFNARYGAPAGSEALPPFVLAAGDGNHSLATAKAYWELCKKNLTTIELENHPARFCLVELENIQSPAIDIEPIHRVVFGLNSTDFVRYLEQQAQKNDCLLVRGNKSKQNFRLIQGEQEILFSVLSPPSPLTVGSFEALIANIETDVPGTSVDYIHGESDLRALAGANTVGILLPDFEKSDLFKGIALGGVLPKKTFSMGHALEKRYYLECRAITK